MSESSVVTRPVIVSFTTLTAQSPAKKFETIAWPERLTTMDELQHLGELLVGNMCPRHRHPELTFHINAIADTIDPVIEQFLVWRPDMVGDKPMSRWTHDQQIATVVMNAICAVTPAWCEALPSKTIRCAVSSDEATATVALSFKGKLHPQRLRS